MIPDITCQVQDDDSKLLCVIIMCAVFTLLVYVFNIKLNCSCSSCSLSRNIIFRCVWWMNKHNTQVHMPSTDIWKSS